MGYKSTITAPPAHPKPVPQCNNILILRHGSLCSPLHGLARAKSRPEKVTSPPCSLLTSPDEASSGSAGRQLSLSNPKLLFLVLGPGIFHALQTLPGFDTHTSQCFSSCTHRLGASRVGNARQCRRAQNATTKEDRQHNHFSCFRGPPQGTAPPGATGTGTRQSPFHTLTTPTHAQTKALRPDHGHVAAFACPSQSPLLAQRLFLAPACKDLYFVMQRPPGTLKTRPTSHQHLPRLVPVPVGVRGGGFALREGRLGWNL